MNNNFCKKLDLFIDTYYATNKNSGYLRITYKDEIIYEKSIGFSDIEEKKPFTKESVFTFYSLSKPFLAIGVLKLHEENKINIDCHPGKYLPEAEMFDKRVTIRQMLQHTSGLPDFVQTAFFDKKYNTGHPAQLRERTKELTKYPMVFAPGTDGMYANVNYILCAIIIENITGMSYSDYMKKEVLEPLGMKTAQIDSVDLKVDFRVKGYEIENGNIIHVERTTDWIYGAGDIIGTADDVYCLNKAIKNELLLKKETWSEILTPSSFYSMGLGCCVSEWHGKKRITHNGGHKGFRTLHIQLPEDDFDIIFLSNSGWGNARDDFAEAIYELYYGKDNSISEKVKMDVGYI